jgi:hypothetical protein
VEERITLTNKTHTFEVKLSGLFPNFGETESPTDCRNCRRLDRDHLLIESPAAIATYPDLLIALLLGGDGIIFVATVSNAPIKL